MDASQTASKIAEYLLEAKAVKLQPQQPFTWASGWRSPIYCDNRIALSYPHIRTYIKEQLSELVKKEFPQATLIAGVATAGIAQAALVADWLGLPFAYVRPEPKTHGMKNQVEGYIERGSRIVVIEDLISTGRSSLKAVQALRDEGFEVTGLAAIFTYGFAISEKNFIEAKCKFATLSNYSELIRVASAKGNVSPAEMESLAKWHESPETWDINPVAL